jgi:hypothetical protein
MNRKRLVIVGVAAVACIVPAATALASASSRHQTEATPTLVQQVRDATHDFLDVNNAAGGGYASLGSCVSGPQEGAMGIHYGNDTFLGDGEVQADSPELLIYEQRGGERRLLGVEYLVTVDAWTAAGHDSPPVLVGQHFQFVSAPNRYGLPAFYELHVWAWQDNPSGTFADWNPAVSCDEYTGEPDGAHAGH